MSSEVAISHRVEVPDGPAAYFQDSVDSVESMLREALGGIGGIESVVHRGDRVVLKVNAGFKGSPGVHTTDPRVVEALIHIIGDRVDPARIAIAENAAERHFLDENGLGATTCECFEACGLAEVARRTGAELVALEDDDHIEINLAEARAFPKFSIPRTIVQADVLIYVPHLKVHMAAGVTLNIKLSQGVLPTRDKKRCHRVDLAQKLVDVLKVVRPHLSIIDGLWAQQGQGPTSPYEEDIIRDMNVIVAGKDPVSVDAVGSVLMGLDPCEVKTTWIASRQGLGEGTLERITLSGENIARVKRTFKRPSLILEETFPNMAFHIGGACEGCISHLRMYLDQLQAVHLLEKLPERIHVVVGFGAVPLDLGRYNLIVGDCTSEHKRKGLFVEGCCPLSRILWGLLDLISAMVPDVSAFLAA